MIISEHLIEDVTTTENTDQKNLVEPGNTIKSKSITLSFFIIYSFAYSVPGVFIRFSIKFLYYFIPFSFVYRVRVYIHGNNKWYVPVLYSYNIDHRNC